MKGDMYIARSSDEETLQKAECGGAVSSLLKFALDSGRVDTVLAIKARDGNRYNGIPVLVTDPKEVTKTAGSLHCTSPNIARFLTEYLDGASNLKIAVVTKPCDAKAIVELAKATNAKIEVNLFYRSSTREEAIKHILKKFGANEIFGLNKNNLTTLSKLDSERRKVDIRGILTADVVLVPLEDGDRTEALIAMGKKVIAIDLNPLSRTSRKASITIVDNIERAIPLFLKEIKILKNKTKDELKEILQGFDNTENLGNCLETISNRLSKIKEQRLFIEFEQDFDYEA